MSKKFPEVGEVWSISEFPISQAILITDDYRNVPIWGDSGPFVVGSLCEGRSTHDEIARIGQRLAKSPKKFFKKLARGDFQ